MKKTYLLAAAAVFLASGSSFAAGMTDIRPNKTSASSQYYCVRNSESGVCEDCVSKGDPAHQSSTCSELKNATNNPLVRSGHCSDTANKDFCKVPGK